MFIPELVACLVVSGAMVYFYTALFEPNWLRILIFRIKKGRTLQSFVEDRLVCMAEKRVCVFTGMLHTHGSKEVFSFLAQASFPVRLLVGPEVDVSALPVLKALMANSTVQVFLVDRSFRSEIERMHKGRLCWSYRHFCVIDGKHLSVVDEYTPAHQYSQVPASRELRNFPTIARFYEHRFEKLIERYGRKVDQDFIEFIAQHGQWVTSDHQGSTTSVSDEQVRQMNDPSSSPTP